MPKIRPSEAKGGKRRKPKDADSRMARLIATALAKDKNTMQELKDLINKQETDDEDVQTQREDGTYVDQDDNTNVNLSGEDTASSSGESSEGSDSELEDDLTGPYPPGGHSGESIDLGTFSAVHSPVDKKLKEKIFNMQYIDLSHLYYKNSISETTTIKKTKSEMVTSVQKSAPKQISNILTWCRAFQIYADVYCTKYQDESSQLFQYMTLIQNLANHTRHWQLYDEKFRQLRAVSPVPWGKIHTETYLYCCIAQTSSFRSYNNNNNQNNNLYGSAFKLPPHIMFRKGYCWDYQRLSSCPKQKCNVLHQCANCEGPTHGASKCNRPASQRKPTESSKHPSKN
ncbi:uncharacterized protein LOC128555531 [Mercenaria mercenaria]|uniref:uncharacterized protein LOC128555531 n=1 Tax=Mercenaria mercenaria TaxID=6596 RepID=UPI00234F1B82|nr:uncharacterized protein LOC128555531 [Mercenaria mercenaria]